MRFFAPQERHVAPMGVKFDMKEGTVTLLNVRVCAPDFAMRALDYRNYFDTVE